MTDKALTLAQIAVLEQKPPVKNGLCPCFALAFGSLQEHPKVCDVLMARAEKYKDQYGHYQQQNNGRSAYIDGLQQASDLLLTLVQALYDTKGNLNYNDIYLKRINDSFTSTVNTINLMMEMVQHE